MSFVEEKKTNGKIMHCRVQTEGAYCMEKIGNWPNRTWPCQNLKKNQN